MRKKCQGYNTEDDRASSTQLKKYETCLREYNHYKCILLQEPFTLTVGTDNINIRARAFIWDSLRFVGILGGG